MLEIKKGFPRETAFVLKPEQASDTMRREKWAGGKSETLNGCRKQVLGAKVRGELMEGSKESDHKGLIC